MASRVLASVAPATLLSVTLTGVTLMGAGVAHADSTASPRVLPAVTHTTCHLAGSETFTPGVTMTPKPQTVPVKGTLSSCAGGGVTKGTYSGTLKSSSLACGAGASHNAPLKGVVTVKWNNGTTSSVSVVDQSDETNNKFSGKVTSGTFKGDALIGSAKFTGYTGNCVSSPITAAKYAGTVKL